jgi:hypothetical protein
LTVREDPGNGFHAPGYSHDDKEPKIKEKSKIYAE